ncbi:MAG: hypothetical protein J6B56_02065 [Clostridia bacterium]|nr:hypothetical protein [Clostridia bacterium]
MAKKKVAVTAEKVVDKKVNLVSLAIAVVLFAVAAFGYSTTLSPELAILGIPFSISADQISEMFAGYLFVRDVIGFILVLVCAILQLIALIKLIVQFCKLFGFLGKKDVEVMKKKLANYAKAVFGTIGLELTILIIASYDNGVLSGGASTLMILTGVLFFALYGLTRYYRWFVLEKRYWLDCLFEGLKDALFIACPIFLLCLIDGRFLGTFGDLLFTMYGNMTSEFITATAVSGIINGAASIIYMFITLALMRKTLKLMPFNNYKKSAYDTKGRYIALFVIAVLFAASSAVTSAVNSDGINGNAIVPALIPALLTTLPYLFAMVGICIGSSINEKETAKVEYVEVDEEEAEAPAEEAETPVEVAATEE